MLRRRNTRNMADSRGPRKRAVSPLRWGSVRPPYTLGEFDPVMPEHQLQPGDFTPLQPLVVSGSSLPAGMSAMEEEAGLDWRRYLHVAQRYRWWILLVTAIGLAGGVLVSRFVKPKYAAQGTIWIAVGDRTPGTPDRGPIQSPELLDAEAWLDLLKSYVVLDEVVRAQHLYLHTSNPTDWRAFGAFGLADRYRPGSYRLTVDADGRTFTLSAKGGLIVQRGAVGDSVGTTVGFVWLPPRSALPPGSSMGFTLVTPREAAHKLGNDLTADMDPKGNFMRLSLDGGDPIQVAAILNTVMERYVQVAADLKRAKLIALTKILDAQLSSSGENLRNAENALETFRVQTITLPTDRGGSGTPVAPGIESTRDPVFANYFDMKIDLDQTRRDREALQHLLAQLPDSGLPVEALAAIGAVQRSNELSDALKELTTKQADLRALRYRYTDATPAVQRLADEIDTLERASIPGLAAGLVNELTAHEQTLSQRVDAAGSELREIPSRAIEEARLAREVAIDENLYTTLQQRYEEARLADASSMPDISVLDPAVAPENPIKNTVPQTVLFGLLGGLGLALAGAVLLDRMDPRIRYPNEVTRGFGLPIIGALPHVKTAKNGKAASADTDGQAAIEALRGIRLNLIHALGTADPLVLTISSPGSGDGKSFLSSNLALTFGDAGYKTVVIDGDVRRGALHRVLGAARTPGLTELLAGSASVDQVIQPTQYPAVSFIGSGSRQHSSPELLGSPAMNELLGALRRRFHVILMDSPPLGAGIDPYVLGAATGNLVVVLRTGSTDRALTRARLEMLDRLPIRVLGAILNDIPPSGAYYYNYYYSYSYVPGYATEQEQSATVRRLPRPG